jgi:hypothetical protein
MRQANHEPLTVMMKFSVLAGDPGTYRRPESDCLQDTIALDGSDTVRALPASAKRTTGSTSLTNFGNSWHRRMASRMSRLGPLWTAHRIDRDNAPFRNSSDFRRLDMPFAGLGFFADAGNGDQFAVSLSGNHEVYVWNHADDSRVWVAPTVMRYLEDWMTGSLKV